MTFYDQVRPNYTSDEAVSKAVLNTSAGQADVCIFAKNYTYPNKQIIKLMGSFHFKRAHQTV
jgi:hypothetical protein